MEQAQTKTHPILLAAGTAVLLFSLLGAAAITGVLPSAASGPASTSFLHAAKPCPNCGTVESVRQVEVAGKSSGLGAVAGGVAGGLLGNQFGHGAGNAVLTVGGAAGGAFAGDAIEKKVKTHAAWRIVVRLEDGTVRTLSQAAQPPFAVGDRVKVYGSAIERA